MEENNDANVEELKTVDGVFIDDTVETLEIPDIENAEEIKEQENIETEQEGGL